MLYYGAGDAVFVLGSDFALGGSGGKESIEG